jgi:D-glycero-beta-D-manno-heptose 1-phosphate adenylyltransferase
MTIAPKSKIMPIEQLREAVERARAAGRVVVLANGCFDLIHVGHIRYLQEAKKRGDILVVAINSDASVGALKGPGRPLQSQTERAEILASLECVDLVVVFDSATVDPLLLMLRPDIHAKGTDYTCENVPERHTVLSYGGQVAIVGDSKCHSTRDVIKSILMVSEPCKRQKRS